MWLALWNRGCLYGILTTLIQRWKSIFVRFCVGRKIEIFWWIFEILLKSGNDEMFYFIQSLLQSVPTGRSSRPTIPEYSTLYAFLQSSYSFAAWSWLVDHQWSLSLQWLGRFWLIDQWENFIQFWKSKRMRRGSPISFVWTIKLPVSHPMTHYIKN